MTLLFKDGAGFSEHLAHRLLKLPSHRMAPASQQRARVLLEKRLDARSRSQGNGDRRSLGPQQFLSQILLFPGVSVAAHSTIVERIGFGCFATSFRLTQFKKELNHGVEGRCFYVCGRKECREAAAAPVDPTCDHSCLLCTMGIPRVDGDHGN